MGEVPGLAPDWSAMLGDGMLLRDEIVPDELFLGLVRDADAVEHRPEDGCGQPLLCVDEPGGHEGSAVIPGCHRLSSMGIPCINQSGVRRSDSAANA